MRRRYRVAWHVVNAILTLLFCRRIAGREFIPREGGFIVACNHISFWDPPLVGAAIRREVHYLAKEELFRNRVFGWLITNLNAIPVRRGLAEHSSMKRALGVVSRGRGLVLFPEGTRATRGELLPPLPGVGLLAVKAGVAVVPAYIRGSNAIKRAVIRLRRIELTFGEPYLVPPEAGGTGSKELYRTVGSEVMRRIAELKRAAEREA
ncbi:MAG: lysophospholipid acyltransferase family protein [Candidatus Eisenbacteria bacterium]